MLIDSTRDKAEKGAIIDEVTVCQTQLAKSATLRHEGGDGLVTDAAALLKVDLEDMATPIRERQDGRIPHLVAVIEFKPLEGSAVLGQLDHALIRDISTVRHVEALDTSAVLSQGVDRLFGYLDVVGDVEGQQVWVVSDEFDEASIGEFPAVCEGQALDARAVCKGLDATIVDIAGERGQVKASDKVAVGEVGLVIGEGTADLGLAVPVGTGGPVPEQVDGVLREAFAGEHAVEQVDRRGREFAEDVDQHLIR